MTNTRWSFPLCTVEKLLTAENLLLKLEVDLRQLRDKSSRSVIVEKPEHSHGVSFLSLY